MCWKTTIFVKPSQPGFEAYGIHFQNEEEAFTLLGFPTFWSAWAFCICNGVDVEIFTKRRGVLLSPSSIDLSLDRGETPEEPKKKTRQRKSKISR